VTSFVDTNSFVRLLVRDPDRKVEQCREFVERAKRGEVNFFTSEAIVA